MSESAGNEAEPASVRGPAADRRYYTLDGIRGIAAIYVVIGHSNDLFALPLAPRFWLAVDLFFLMSGFVLGRVYEPRFAAGMTTRQFMLQRYVRLYPLYFAGLALGIVSGAVALALHKGALAPSDFAIAVVTGLLILPSPTWASQKDIIPLNFPGWSLFFELAINLVFVALWRHLTDRVLTIVIGCSALLLVYGFAIGAQFGGEGWDNVHWGLPRITFSFFLGVLLNRRAAHAERRSDLAWLLVLAPAVLLWLDPPYGGLLDAALVFVGFPLLIAWSARIQPKRTRAFELLGAVSYPAYVLHLPILSILWRASLYFGYPPSEEAPWLGIAYLAAVLVIALLADRFYDRAARRWLLDRLARFPRRARSLAAADTPL